MAKASGTTGERRIPHARPPPLLTSARLEWLMSGVSRRDFFKLGAGGALVTSFGFDVAEAHVSARQLKIARTTETRTTCPYCSVSCGVVLHTLGDRAKNVKPHVVHVEGDPDHPINGGTLCPKGVTLKRDIHNEGRLTQPRYRAPGASEWTDISWDEAIRRIAKGVKKVRDETFEATDGLGRTVNRTPGLSVIGGCTDANEVNFLLVKAARSLGVLYIENQARI